MYIPDWESTLVSVWSFFLLFSGLAVFRNAASKYVKNNTAHLQHYYLLKGSENKVFVSYRD